MIILIAVNVGVDFYIWRRIERNSRRRWPGVAYAWSSLLLFVFAVVTVCLPRRGGSDSVLVADMWMLFSYLSVYICKWVFIIISAIGALPALWKRPRLKGWDTAGAVISIALFAVIWWGALINRNRIDIKEITVVDPSLPQQFDGYRIVQFSDFHVGTYGTDTTFVSRVVDAINNIDADAIMFTGDIVNRHTEELLPFVKPLSRLHARDGVYSILGNHDYGDYYAWANPQDKVDNLDLLKRLQADMGWQLLNNESRMIYSAGGDSIAVIGVENWGDPPFPTYGDLRKAYPELGDQVYKVLLTHNPVHWTREVADNDSANVALTLSGHTHAMQIEIGSWSPAKWRYPTWGGAYYDRSGHTLYVNIGLGTVGMPMRIGATPEITIITLKRSDNS